MYSSWKLCISKIKRNKVQNTLISLIILLSTLLLATALVVIKNTNSSYLDKHDELNGSHEILELKNGIHNPDDINAWWKSQSGVTSSDIMRYGTMTGVNHEDKSINVELYMVDASSYSGQVDRLLFVNGNEQETPDEGSIWIPTSLACSNRINVGDKLIFKTDNSEFSLRVAGIVIDLPYCAPFSTSARIWVNKDDYNQFVHNPQKDDYFMMSLRFSDYTASRSYWEAFEDFLGTPYLESVRNFENLSSFYMITNKIIGFVMIFLAVVMLAIAISSIGFTISDDIISNYKTFGIIKSLGMTTFQSIFVYVSQYALLAVFSVIIGISASYFLSKIIIDSSLEYLKAENSSINLQFSSIACGVFFLLVFAVIACAFIFSYKARGIQPVQAIRFGASETNNRKSTSRMNYISQRIANFEYLPVTLVVGLRGMFRKFRSNTLIIIISALMTAVLVFGFTFINSFAGIQQTIAMWGYDSSDLTVNVENISDASFNDFKNNLSDDVRVENHSMFSEINAVIPAVKNLETGEVLSDSMAVFLSVVEGSYDDIGFTNIEGQNPINGDEISIGVNLANKYNIEVGDVFAVYIEGEKCEFVVTGIYQAIANMAYSGRICVEGVRKIRPDYNTKEIVFINVYDNVSSAERDNDINKLADDINNRYGSNISASTQAELINEVFSTAIALLILPMLIIGIVFVLIALIIIYCNCHISIKKEINTYGIYKSVGMHSSSIRFSIVSGVLVLEFIGALIGALIGIGLLPKLLNFVLSNYGIVSMPLVINYAGIFFVAMTGVLIASMGAWFSSKKIQKTTSRILTVE